MYGPADTAGLVHLQPQVMVKAGDGAVVLVDDEVGTGRAVRIVSVIGTARRSPGWGCGGGRRCCRQQQPQQRAPITLMRRWIISGLVFGGGFLPRPDSMAANRDGVGLPPRSAALPSSWCA